LADWICAWHIGLAVPGARLIVLALDLSKTSTGWAVGDGKEWRFGTLKCPIHAPESLRPTDIDADYAGAVSNWFRASLFAIIETHRPTAAAIEKPLPGNLTERKKYFRKETDAFGESLVSVPAGGTSFATLFFLYGLAFEATGLLARKAIPTTFVAAQTWRKAVGIGQKPKSSKDGKFYKNEAIRQCRLRGFDVSSSDAAEALLIAVYLCGKLNLDARVGALL